MPKVQEAEALAFLEFSRKTVISLEMLKAYARIFVECESHLKAIEEKIFASQITFQEMGRYKMDPTVLIGNEQAFDILFSLGRVSFECQQLGLVDQELMADRIGDLVKPGAFAERVKCEIRVLRESL
jgi:hypothetical protein